jgi:D-3-phosphoglycerate dehydrogenase
MRILVSDRIADEGLDILSSYTETDVMLGLSSNELELIIGKYDALIVRSQTEVTRRVIEAGQRLYVIGRAGVGIDNIDVEAATQHGIIVVNSPEGNIVSTAEHTIAMMLTLARSIPKAHSQLQNGIWDRSIKGIQLRNKTIGIIGLGRVGTQVADMAHGLHMNVIACDPVIRKSKADILGIEMVELDSLLKTADFISIHVPLNSTTRGLISREKLTLLKPTAMLINCARGGIVDEDALYEALEKGAIAGAAVDVFSKEPGANNILLRSDRVLATPHLAASTNEAEKSIAQQVVDILNGYPAKSPINIPLIPVEAMSTIGPYINVGITIAKIAAQLMVGQLRSISIVYQGEIAREDTIPIRIAVLAGLLGILTEERVNMVNADKIASDRGLKISEQKDINCDNYANLVILTLETESGNTVVAGSSIRGEVHLIKVNEYWLEIEPKGNYMLFTEHKDQPGMIGAVGTIIGNASINISQMQVSRGVKRGGNAMMVLCLDNHMTEECYHQILSIPHMKKALLVEFAL